MPDETLVGSAGQSSSVNDTPGSPGPGSVLECLPFLRAGQYEDTAVGSFGPPASPPAGEQDRTLQRPPPQGTLTGAVVPAADQQDATLVGPSVPATHTPGSSPPAPTWTPGTGSAPTHDETLQKPPSISATPYLPTATSTDGRTGQNGMPTDIGEQPHGETLVKPSSASASSGSSAGPGGAPATVTGYEILGVLGRGGMGVVYKARQRGLNRTVALKMILHGGHASTEDLVRFKIEAQAVALLQHPNIVQIYDNGERDGRPYFALEFLEGGSLQQRLDGTPIPPRVAAHLIEQLARAMDFAHRRGIVHRDLKPANILLAEAPGTALEACTPKITDFGLAKRLQDDQGQTGTEAILGTPTYMAPEQAAGKTREVGPAADIYALGAILYDMLTGRPPFKGDTVMDTLHMVQMVDPVPPVRLQPRCPLDLQTICLKCLEKDPYKRYGSAGELADDLERFLDGRPITARPTTRLERTWKWVRRRPAAAALLALSILAPLVVTVVSVVAAVQVSKVNADLGVAYDELKDRNEEIKEKRDALNKSLQTELKLTGDLKEKKAALEKSLKQEKALKSLAERREKEAQDSFLRAQAAAVRVLGLVREKLRNEPGTEKLRKALLKDAVEMYREFAVNPSTTPAARHRAARAYRLMAELQAELGEHANAEKNYRQSLKLYDDLITESKGKKGQPDYAGERVATAMDLWRLLEEIDQKKAEQELQEVSAQMEKAKGKSSSPQHRLNRAVVLANQAIHEQNRGRYEPAAKNYQEAARLLAGLEGVSGVRGVTLERARVEINRSALWLVGKPSWSAEQREEAWEKAADACDRAIEWLDRLLRDDPRDIQAARELGRAYTSKGLVYLVQRDYTESGRTYAKAVRVFEKLQKGHTDIVDFRHLLGVALGNQGQYFLHVRPIVALKVLTRGREILEELVRDFSDVSTFRQDLARVCSGQGTAYLQLREPAEAEEPLKKAVQLLEEEARDSRKKEKLRGDLLAVYQNLIVCHYRQAIAARDRKDWARAERQVRPLVRVQRKRVELLSMPLPEDSSWQARAGRWLELLLARADLVKTMLAHGKVLVERRKHRAAEKEFKQMEKEVSKTWPGWVEVAGLLCRCIRLAKEDDLSRREQAEAVARYGNRALAILERLGGRIPDLDRELKKDDFRPLREGAFRARYQRLLRQAEGRK
jgi:serine/threonine protein kinase/tetratricopeptide (TPR) repeat protein